MADVPPGTKRFLWHERLHEVDRYEAARPEDLRGEPPDGGEVRFRESTHCLLTSSATSGRPVRRGVRERCNRPIREPSRERPGKDTRLMGGGESMASFFETPAADEFRILLAAS